MFQELFGIALNIFQSGWNTKSMFLWMNDYLAPPVMRMVLFWGGLAVEGVRVYTGEAIVRAIYSIGWQEIVWIESQNSMICQ